MTEKVEKSIWQDLAALSPTPILYVYSFFSTRVYNSSHKINTTFLSTPCLDVTVSVMFTLRLDTWTKTDTFHDYLSANRGK